MEASVIQLLYRRGTRCCGLGLSGVTLRFRVIVIQLAFVDFADSFCWLIFLGAFHQGGP